jgi:hypothetical protein
MVGAEYDPPATHFGFYRWMIDLNKNPELSWIRDDRCAPGPTSIFHSENFIGLFAYPIRGGNLINISPAHRDKRDQDSVGMYELGPLHSSF